MSEVNVSIDKPVPLCVIKWNDSDSDDDTWMTQHKSIYCMCAYFKDFKRIDVSVQLHFKET